MGHSLRRLIFLVICSLSLAAPAGAASLRGEASLDVRAQHRGGTTVAEIYEARGSLLVPAGRRLGFYTDAGVREDRGRIDELYAACQVSSARLRLGRFFLPIGIHTRSELYYTGFVQLPILKYYSFDGFVEFRSEQGVTLEGGAPRLRYEVGLAGGDGSPLSLGLNRPQDLSVRLQAFTGRLILGLNGYTGETRWTRIPPPGGGPGGSPGARRAARLAGLDWRYSAPTWIARGEWLSLRVAGQSFSGGYLDLLYHPLALPAWTFVARAERVRHRGTLRRLTLGTRHVPARGWAIHLNWIYDSPAYGGQGLHLQVLRTQEY